MTYIVGLSYRGMNSIVADSRQSWNSNVGNRLEGDNHVLKSGSLFPGCIFGRAGNPKGSRDLILSFKDFLREKPDDSIAGFWNRFVAFADRYRFPTAPEERFQILLSTRAFGQPRFFLVDSTTGLTAVDDLRSIGGAGLFTLGSGKEALDEQLFSDFAGRLAFLQEYAKHNTKADGFLQELAPYALALWLNERSTSFERVSLEEYHGVGGLFHFILQVRDCEAYQKPAVYLMVASSGSANDIRFWLHRVCFVRNWLFVQWNSEDGDGAHKEAYIDDCSLPPRQDGKQHDLDELYQDLRGNLEAEIIDQPFYFFCGVGFADCLFRRSMILHVTTEKDYQIDPNGPGNTVRIRPAFFEMIRDNFRP
ncbi:MAG: hypothetical protein EHM18_09710 [Acidobacteria bacterium]|nr:MAG: hypothetical protein EHM18_09710 [Acidobacteriota bacterium]